MADEDSHSTDTSVSGEVKKVILISILLAHTRIFTRLILMLMRSRLAHTFFGFNCGLWAPDYAAKLHKNAWNLVKFTYFCIRLNKGREQQKTFSVFFSNFCANFLLNCGKLLRKFWSNLWKAQGLGFSTPNPLGQSRRHDVQCQGEQLQPPRAICSVYHTTHIKLSGIVWT